MKRFIIVLFIAILIPNIAYCGEYEDYIEAYDLSMFQDEMGKDSYSYLEQLGISDFDYNSITSISLKDIVDIAKMMILNSYETPLQASLVVLVFVLLSSMFQSIKPDGLDNLSSTYSTASALIIALVLLVKIGNTVSISAGVISIASNFVYAFVPAFCAIVVASGGVTTAFSTNTLLLSLSQGLSFVSSNVFLPLINCYMAIGICSSLRYQLNLSRLLSTMRRIITTAISVSAAAFVSILSIKTAVASRADAIGLRSIRFAINSVVPVIGSAISEGLLSIQSYSSLIKSSVGIVGIIAISLVFMPAIIEVAIWRFMLAICELVSDIFGDNSVSLIIKTFKNSMLLMNVILILSMVVTIISIGILIAARTS